MTRTDGPTGTITGETTEPVHDSEEQPVTTDERTTVRVHCTGHVRAAVGEPRLSVTFSGTTLRKFLAEFFERYDVEELLIAETEADATTRGWAPRSDPPPGSWRKNPEGEQTRAYARVAINGRFNEHLDGLDTELKDGDRVSLMYPFLFCL